MFFSFEKDKNRSYIYQQIYEELKYHILNRKLKANEKLPSKRKLAEQLNVSVNSVTNAYEQLLAEGYIYTKERKGYYVENITPFIHQEASTEHKLPSDLKETVHDEEGWLSLSHMTSDVSAFPFSEWMKCQQRAIKNHKKELSELPHPQGPYLVRKTISNIIAMSRGVICEPEQIVIGAGTQLLIRALMEIKQNDTVVAMEDPGYSRIYTLLKNMGFDVRTLHLDEEGIDMKEIESDINFLFVTPSHQFPTGKIMPISRRIELLNWSTQGFNRYIVEDDYDSEFKYETDHIPSLQSLDRNHRVIYTGTFSKTILPGLRISYMVLPPNMLKAYRNYHYNLMQNSNSLALYTLHYFVETGGYARHLKRMNHLYELKRKILIRQIEKRFGHLVTIDNIPAGLHFLAKFQTKISYERFERRIKEEKLEVYSMRRFQLKNIDKKKATIELVLGFANIKEEQIPEAVDRLYRVLY
ncbi:MocR-like transcriptional regulator GabR [Virgibacillus alimentarius]|uniref:GntR family transcriptional regulator/MocR family aminotransferase n=1 Tax=Virgibacillus alimentarius TaxID=698769 RepID=A0ABS4S5D3_9BACI|nr:PLP-dependent aminotransferase family protein [Virgibacillus alimentarius]MBP2256707.1 GntR family transcriptional regulator/MocR family aminotransferase [Virgibacillus alimentarius]